MISIDLIDQRMFGIRELLQFQKQFGQIQFKCRILWMLNGFFVVINCLCILMGFNVDATKFGGQQWIVRILPKCLFECIDRLVRLYKNENLYSCARSRCRTYLESKCMHRQALNNFPNRDNCRPTL